MTFRTRASQGLPKRLTSQLGPTAYARRPVRQSRVRFLTLLLGIRETTRSLRRPDRASSSSRRVAVVSLLRLYQSLIDGLSRSEQEYAGLGGDAQFVKAEQEGSISRSLGGGYVSGRSSLESNRFVLTRDIPVCLRSPPACRRDLASSSLCLLKPPLPARTSGRLSSPIVTTSAGQLRSGSSDSTRSAPRT